MNTHKPAALIFVFALFLITGCQQSHLSANKPVTNQTFKKANAQDRHIRQPYGQHATKNQHTTRDQHATKNGNQQYDTRAGKQTQNTDQGRIDKALELCSVAQNYWEEGNLDEALSSLDEAYALMLEITPSDNPEVDQQKEDIRYLLSKRILEIYASRQTVVTGHHGAIPITLNDHVNAEIQRLTGPERNFFTSALNRSYRYRPFIVQELKKAGLPEEISWLPLIESGFKNRALSPARALGLWQFIPSTGNKFGLSRNHYIDERMDPEKATRAAIDYLKELHNLFGDWTTALAAYNCGEYRVLKTIRRQKINYLDNFWDLYQSLPRETARYVPRFLATVHIVKNLEKYNIAINQPLKPIEYKPFNIKKQVRLSEIADAINVDTATLVSLNPELRHEVLPPEFYTVKIPVDHADQFMAKIDAIKTTYSQPAPQYAKTTTYLKKRPGSRYTHYRVQKGDTLSGIARKFNTSISTIAKCNKISKRCRVVTGKVLKIPGTTFSKYKVKSGDNALQIAKRHDMSLDRLLSLNHLSDGNKIYPGQSLLVE